MYTLKTNASFDSAHFLKGYEGKCSNIHGHRWTIEVTVYGEQLKEDQQMRGMLVDFSTLKEDVRALAQNLDHAFIIEENSMRPLTKNALLEDGFRLIEVPFRPTAENFANYIFQEMKKKGYSVKEAVVYETPNNCAGYSEE